MNLAVRFAMEMTALGALGYWGWHQGQGAVRIVLAIALPLLAAVVWGVFAVPRDPSRSGQAPVPVPGLVRLGLELAFFGAAVWAPQDVGSRSWALALALVTVVHYVASYDRIRWLIAR